jgi:16S rRNA (cytosine1402-N4)-methyltransferase
MAKAVSHPQSEPSLSLRPHQPVMLAEVLKAVEPDERKTIVDGTFGAGGYSEAFLQKGAQVIAFDRDPAAVKAAQELKDHYGERFTFISQNFSTLYKALKEHNTLPVDAIVLDIGVSSMHLDQAERGFSFQQDGPLDMRMSQQGVTAADLVNHLPEDELADIFYYYGEERKARVLARKIVEERCKAPFDTTRQLVKLIQSCVPASHKGPHPATRSFQALRIAVNSELHELRDALLASEQCLSEGGRLAVVTFHSLEDRMVKQFMAEAARTSLGQSRHQPLLADDQLQPVFRLVPRKAITASEKEIAANPRSRSARLRVAERLSTPARHHTVEPDIEGHLPVYSSLRF